MLAALRLVERTGEGQVVDVNLLATAAWTMSTDLSSTLVDGQDPPVLGRRRRRHALQESFRTADDRWILLFMPEPHWWPRFCAVAGRPEWVDDPRLATVRVALRAHAARHRPHGRAVRHPHARRVGRGRSTRPA